MDSPESVSQASWAELEAARLHVAFDPNEAARIARNRQSLADAEARLMREIAARRKWPR